MKHKKIYREQSSNVAADGNQNESHFAAEPDEVVRRACYSHVNQSASQGHEVQHWLEGEAKLLAERKLARIHGFYNRK